ncbi:winged helix-turn-helix domain-containing protein, partial [Sinorhizobium meliloti]
MTIRLSNRDARRIFLAKQGLSAAPHRALGKDGLLQLIHDIGFVQVDSIATVERAHHQILFSRNQTYRREHLAELLEKDGELFEHWTHDASIIPSTFFIYWKHRFKWESETLRERWRKWRGEDFDAGCEETYARIANNGAVMARHLKEDGHESGGWWNWHPSKTALEVLWRQGKLAIARRENFQKVYDLTERVIPARHYDGEVAHEEFIDWACRSALERLGFATHGEIAAFW